MKPNLVPRAIAAIAGGVLFGTYMHYDYVRWGQRGREAFLAHQLHRFDVYMVAPRPIAVTLFAATLVVVGGLAIYEALTALFAWILDVVSGTGAQ